MCFSIAQAEEKDNTVVEVEPSNVAVIYIAEGTQTNLLEVTKIEKVKLLDKRKKVKKKLKQNKERRESISNQTNKKAGEKIKEKKHKQFVLNHKTDTTLFLSSYFKHNFTQSSGKHQFKIWVNKQDAKALASNSLPRNLSFCISLFDIRNALTNKILTRPPPTYV